MTTQSIRLIGGANNGEIVRVEPDQVQLVARKYMASPQQRAFSKTYALADSLTEVKTTTYTRRTVKLSDGDVTFFAPEDCSDFDALNLVVGV